ncbi:uncharacterized protein [Antedon mediterranea]|uniref:uncharacterized protein n=1 Tax=Antedon mediterranea TaxID=105859 RepID=UPI003AF6F668
MLRRVLPALFKHETTIIGPWRVVTRGAQQRRVPPRRLLKKKKNNLPPYQGEAMMFGEFYCSHCDRLWYSVNNTWAYQGKECPKCKVDVDPRKQTTKKRTELTPYQGDEDMSLYGEFYCSDCNETWHSISKANVGQKCIRCGVYVYPHKQTVRNKVSTAPEGHQRETT